MDPSSEPPRSASSAETGPATADSARIVTDVFTKPPQATDAPIAASHLARFEFSDHGTKILMVEWYPGAATAPTVSENDADSKPGSQPIASASASHNAPVSPVAEAAVWEVSWPGKSTFLPARDTDEDGTRRRAYFLLPPEAPVPATVTVARPGRPSLVLRPLPAIFPERFDAESGPRGVLHTIWAKKRLIELEREMAAELRTNAESVGLEMALAEKQWIVDNFLHAPAPATPAPMTTRPPLAGRLGDKLKGLRLATSPADLVPSPTANTFTGLNSQSHTLSPLIGDVAVSSFSAISRGSVTGPISLNAALQGDIIPQLPELQDDDDLFAMPISPRSPDMKKSPFSALGIGP